MHDFTESMDGFQVICPKKLTFPRFLASYAFFPSNPQSQALCFWYLVQGPDQA